MHISLAISLLREGYEFQNSLIVYDHEINLHTVNQIQFDIIGYD